MFHQTCRSQEALRQSRLLHLFCWHWGAWWTLWWGKCTGAPVARCFPMYQSWSWPNCSWPQCTWNWGGHGIQIHLVGWLWQTESPTWWGGLKMLRGGVTHSSNSNESSVHITWSWWMVTICPCFMFTTFPFKCGVYISLAGVGSAHKTKCGFGDIDQWLQIGIGQACPHHSMINLSITWQLISKSNVTLFHCVLRTAFFTFLWLCSCGPLWYLLWFLLLWISTGTHGIVHYIL